MKLFMKIGISAFVIISLLATIFFVQTSFAKGAQRGAASTKCKTKWTKIFEGNINSESSQGPSEGWELNVSKVVTYDQLNSLIANGCNFEIVKVIGLGGGQITKSYACQFVSLKDSGGPFTCLSGKFSSTGEEQNAKYDVTELSFGYEPPEGLGDFRPNGKIYYVPTDNEFPELSIYLKLYARG